MLLNEYIQTLIVAIQRLDDYGLADSIESQSEVRIEKTAIVSIKVVLINKSELHVREYIDGLDEIIRVSYAYQYQSEDKSLIFRYDNAQHKPALGFDEHKHTKDGSIIARQLPSINEIIDEVIECLSN